MESTTRPAGWESRRDPGNLRGQRTLRRRQWTPRQRVEAALRGEHADRVPFTLYETKIPQCAAERELRCRGLCIVKRDVPVFITHHPSIKISAEVEWRDGKQFTRTFYQTPCGTLTKLDEAAGFTTWQHEKLFKSPDDYKALRFLLQDEEHEPNYEAFAQAQEAFGDDAIFRAGFGLEPLQALISGDLMDMQEFCIQWMDNRDEVLKLYEILVQKRRAVYSIVAQSPALHANYGGNVVPQIIGRQIFEHFYLPHYQEAAETMHRHGKLIGCHFDDDCSLIADLIARSGLDYIEAFTPAPDTQMTVADARRIWRDKVLWINFPSSLHLQSDEQIKAASLQMLEEAGGVDGLIIGVTEDMPEHRWRSSCSAIMTALEHHPVEHPEHYR